MAVLASAAPSAPAVPAGSAGLERQRIEAIERVLTSYVDTQGVPGLSVAVARDGRVVWSRGFGLADIENQVLATAETRYRTASMGKSITATAAMRLVEEGRVTLDAPIQEWCPAFPRKPWPITLRHLLSHLSGIRHYGGPRDAEEQSSTTHYETVTAALAPFRDDSLRFEPGTDYLYSTYGYDVAGCVIEGAAGAPFMDVIRRTVFAPAGMNDARDDDPSIVIPHRAAGYVRRDGRLLNATHVDMSNRLPAGGYIASAREMAAFAAAFVAGRLVTPATRDSMLRPARLRDGATVNYGIGWGIEEDDAGRSTGRYFHGGSSPGASGMMIVIPGDRVAVVFMTNLESAPERFPTARAVAEILRPGWRP